MTPGEVVGGPQGGAHQPPDEQVLHLAALDGTRARKAHRQEDDRQGEIRELVHRGEDLERHGPLGEEGCRPEDSEEGRALDGEEPRVPEGPVPPPAREGAYQAARGRGDEETAGEEQAVPERASLAGERLAEEIREISAVPGGDRQGEPGEGAVSP